MHAELTWEEWMRFVLDRGLERTFTTCGSGKDGKLRLPFGSQEAKEASHWLDFHGKADSSPLAYSQAWQLGAEGPVWEGACPASSHGLLGIHKGGCKTKLWIGTVVLCLEADWLLWCFVKASPFPLNEVRAALRAVLKSWFSDSRAWRARHAEENEVRAVGCQRRSKAGAGGAASAPVLAYTRPCMPGGSFHQPNGLIALHILLNLNINTLGCLYYVFNYIGRCDSPFSCWLSEF